MSYLVIYFMIVYIFHDINKIDDRTTASDAYICFSVEWETYIQD